MRIGHDNDSIFSSVINIDNIIVQNILAHQSEYKSKFSTGSQSSGHTENISIDESGDNGQHGQSYFGNPIPSTSSQESD